jgi:cobalt-zinc-cadmium resistance protein CzcA
MVAAERPSTIARLVAWALRMPAAVVVVALTVVGAGLYCYSQLDIEAYPNPVPPMVEVITQPIGSSAEEVEKYVTIPLEYELAGMPGLDHLRSQSLFGLSDVKCYFKWGTDYERARQEVINRLQFVQLPSGLQARISPWNAIGEIFRYRVVDTTAEHRYSLLDLKTAQDWILEKQLRYVPGVIDVTGFGGETKQYHVEVEPYRLLGQDITLSQLVSALANANQNVGGDRLPVGEQSFTVRGLGLIRSLHDIGNVVVSMPQRKGTPTGVPIRVRDVGDVAIGHAPRLGVVGKWGCQPRGNSPWYCHGPFRSFDACARARIANASPACVDRDHPDIVQGIVLMRYGAQTSPTLEGIYDRIDYIRAVHLLPPGMDIAPYYDRGTLVELTTHTVRENLLIGMGLVTLVLLLFLANARAALITAVNIPLALLIAFIGMVASGTPANLISLGAVDFGIVVDSTVIMIENVFRHLGKHGTGTIDERICSAAAEVGGPMAFSTLIIAAAFVPLFTMTGVTGVIFAPMAHTYAFAISGAIVLALTLTPVLIKRFIPAQTKERRSVILQFLHRVYNPLFDAALRYPKISVGLALVPIVLCLALFPLLGGEFMPKLEEGNLWIRATLPMSVSLEQSSQYVGTMRGILRRHPEVVTVVSQLGRPDDGTDVAGFFNIELFAPLTPADEWPRGLTKAKLTEQLANELHQEFPRFVFGFSQMIADNVDEALSGVKGENSVKVVGPDLRINEAKANEIVRVMARVRGVEDLGMFHSLGQPSVKIVPDRVRCARYGLNTGDVDDMVRTAVGGQPITQVYEGEKLFDLTVRWAEAFRSSIAAIRRITVSAPANDTRVPIGQIADITEEDGASIIYREDGRRYSPVKFSVRGRDLKSTIEEAQSRIGQQVRLPYDTHLEWAGEINELRRAMSRLIVVIPLTLLLICFLVYSAVRTWIDTVIVFLSIPIACTGGVLALLIAHIHFSVSAAMGFISIFGIAVMDAILVVTYFQRLCATEGTGIEQAAREAAEQRFRPVLMTTLVAMLGLLPAALSNGIGAQTQKPLAVVVIGGSLILAILTRVVQPPLLVLAHRKLGAGRERRTSEKSKSR